MPAHEPMGIEIAWVVGDSVRRLPLRVPTGTRLAQAILIAVRDHGLPASLAADPATGVAVFGRRRPPDHPLFEGDRIELVGPLRVDPMQARRLRAARSRPGGRGERPVAGRADSTA